MIRGLFLIGWIVLMKLVSPFLVLAVGALPWLVCQFVFDLDPSGNPLGVLLMVVMGAGLLFWFVGSSLGGRLFDFID